MRSAVRTLLVATAVSVTGASSLRAQADYPYLGALTDVLTDIRLNYPDSVGMPELVRAAIGGMLRTLDPHSYFMTREESTRRTAVERGELATTGLFFEMVEGRPTVMSVLDGSPAARARIQPGDRLLAIDDTSAAGLSTASPCDTCSEATLDTAATRRRRVFSYQRSAAGRSGLPPA